MGDQIDFGKAWGFDIPGVGFDGDVVFEQGAGLGAAVKPPLELGFPGFESAVDLPSSIRVAVRSWGSGSSVF